MHERGPHIDIAVRQVLPSPSVATSDDPWLDALVQLESRVVDVAVLPLVTAPARFEVHRLYDEDFVIAVNGRHPLSRKPSLRRYADLQHLVVSQSGDPHGFVDDALHAAGLTRRVALTVPSFVFALSLVATSTMVCAVPRRLLDLHAKRFGLRAVEPPLRLRRFQISAVLPRVALRDAGVAWLVEELRKAA